MMPSGQLKKKLKLRRKKIDERNRFLKMTNKRIRDRIEET